MPGPLRIVMNGANVSLAQGLEGFPQSDPPEHLLVALDQNSRPGGWATLCTTLHGQPCKPGFRFVYLRVKSEWRRKGVGTALLHAVVDQAHSLGVKGLDSSHDAADLAAATFAHRHGFHLDYQIVELELDLNGYDLAAWHPALEKVRSERIRLTRLHEEPDRPATERAIWALDGQLSADVPEWSGEVVPFEEYRRENLTGEGFDPESVILARDGDRLVGMSGTKVQSAGSGYTWFAGVDRAFRHRSIATAMKVLTIEWAFSRGLKRLTTHNNGASQGIVSLNRKMGFVVTGACQHVKRNL